MTLFILAGGKSSRMGTDKGLVVVHKKPMVKHIIDTFSELMPKVVIISNNQAYGSFGVSVCADLIKDKGPVGGVFTALSTSTTEINIIISCDTPFVSVELINRLIDNSEGVAVCIPKFNARVHPLIGVYKKSALSVFKTNLKANVLKLMEVNAQLNAKIIEVTQLHKEREFLNLNSKSDVDNVSKFKD